MLPNGSSHATRLTVFNSAVKMNIVQHWRESVLRSHASSQLPVNGRPVEVHAMLCGSVTVKRSHAVCCVPERTPAPLRFLTILADRKFADPMPIWCYAIDHPEGLFVVDAGASPSYNDPTSWEPDARTGAVIRSFIKLDVADGQSLPDQLHSAGLRPDSVRAIVLTHQHIDHTGTVPAFPAAEVWTTRAEDAAANRIGALHWRWRDAATAIRYVDAEENHANPVAAVDLTSDVPSPRFTPPGIRRGPLPCGCAPIRATSGSPVTPRSPLLAWTPPRRQPGSTLTCAKFGYSKPACRTQACFSRRTTRRSPIDSRLRSDESVRKV